MAAPQKYDWPAVLDWIRRRYRDTGWPVTVREIMREHGVSSTSVVLAHLRQWVQEGLLEQQGDGKAGFKPPHKTIIL